MTPLGNLWGSVQNGGGALFKKQDRASFLPDSPDGPCYFLSEA